MVTTSVSVVLVVPFRWFRWFRWFRSGNYARYAGSGGSVLVVSFRCSGFYHMPKICGSPVQWRDLINPYMDVVYIFMIQRSGKTIKVHARMTSLMHYGTNHLSEQPFNGISTK